MKTKFILHIHQKKSLCWMQTILTKSFNGLNKQILPHYQMKLYRKEKILQALILNSRSNNLYAVRFS